MKKLLSSILVLLLLISAVPLFSVGSMAAFAPVDSMDGYQNMVLTYTHNPNRSDMGRHTVEDLMPYVGYYDQSGRMTDFFFDSYLFLPCMSYGPSSARLHYDPENPTKAIDWTTYVEDTFHKGTNVDALDIAFGKAKAELNSPDKKAGVALTILYPGANCINFGSLGGRELDLSKMDDRKYAVKWIIDEQIRLFNERNYQNLDLFAFYWLEEYQMSGAEGFNDVELFKYTSDYLHSKGLQFIWIPWFRANVYKNWREIGFDSVCMQPNMYWMKAVDKKRVDECISDCSMYGMGMEIEIDGNALNSGEHYNRYLDYLKGSLESGVMNSLKMYYQDGKSAVYYNASKATDERARSIYDLTYKYAKGTLKLEDIDARRSDSFTVADDVNWRSIGKKYTATQAYSDGTAIGYQSNDGKELTDGIIGISELDTEWHAFHKTLLDEDGRMSVTVDLGAIYKDLTHFMAHFSHIEMYGIDDPADVKIYTSLDGKNFELLASPELEMVDMVSYVEYQCKPVSAQYVKFSFTNSNANFVFCSEVLVGAGDPPADKAESSVEVSSVPEAENSRIESELPDDVDDSESIWYIWVILGVGAAIAIGVSLFVAIKSKKQ